MNFNALKIIENIHKKIIKQEGHRCPKRRVAQAEIRLATAVITFRKEGKKY